MKNDDFYYKFVPIFIARSSMGDINEIRPVGLLDVWIPFTDYLFHPFSFLGEGSVKI